MATSKPIVITFKIAWWWKYYAFGVRLMSTMTGLEPDDAKVAYWAGKAIRIVRG